ncbi:M23 family metallopeptidase [Nonomuraea sp. NPDC050556]|uniref:M23 family metallopeptidase n=1 Tax=Nonomuraea sp. NPDC050556 TaxID=3364369 RepID=UPI0037964979
MPHTHAPATATPFTLATTPSPAAPQPALLTAPQSTHTPSLRPQPLRAFARRTPTNRLLFVTLLALALITLTPSPAAAAPSPWQWPLSGTPTILRRFAPPPAPWLSGHRGVDLAATPGTPVYAAGPGTITYAGPLAGRGVITILHTAGLKTTYLPVQASVRRGDQISAGARIGIIEDVPGHCAQQCLHWGLLRASRYLDPLLLLGWGQVRLLPYWTTPQPTTPTSRTTAARPLALPVSNPPAALHTPQSATPPRTTQVAADDSPSTATPPLTPTARDTSPNPSPANIGAAATILGGVLLSTALHHRNHRRKQARRPRDQPGHNHQPP